MKVRHALETLPRDSYHRTQLLCEIRRYERVQKMARRLEAETGMDALKVEALEPYFIDLRDAEIVSWDPLALQIADRFIPVGGLYVKAVEGLP